jgi:16S rRNA A1518/A1519 N6-dimethyltransferase RsmA/KsgA/DIM1 with predicted DNA glycosylase/AP lyase activity
VLEIGPASGYLSRRLVEAGCRVGTIEAGVEHFCSKGEEGFSRRLLQVNSLMIPIRSP